MTTDQSTFFLLDAAIPEQRAQWLDLWQTWPHRDVVAHAAYAQLLARPDVRAKWAPRAGFSTH